MAFKAYVPNSTGNSITVINVATNTLDFIIPTAVGANPYGSVVNNKFNATKVYVTNSGNNTVSVIDTILNAIIATIPVGNNPRPIAINNAGTRLYVGNFVDNTISVIDTSTNMVIATIVGISTPSGLITDALDTRLYVTNFDNNTVTVIDITSPLFPIVATIPVGTNPVGIDIAPLPILGNTFLFIANFGSDNYSVINTTTNTVVFTSLPVMGSNPFGVLTRLEFAPSSGLSVYITNSGNNTVSRLAPTGVLFPVVNVIPVSGTPFGISDGDLSANGHVAYALLSSDRLGQIVGNIETVFHVVGNDPISLGHFTGLVPIATPTLTTQASPTVLLGGSVSDNATLSGGASPTGQITFNLYGPNDGTCSTIPVFTSNVPVSGNGTYQSAFFTPTLPGTYRWIANYGGDVNNSPTANTCNAANESVVVNAPLSVTKSFTQSSIAPGGVSTLIITITNTNAFFVAGISFNDNYPGGIVNANPPNATTTPSGIFLPPPVAGGTSLNWTKPTGLFPGESATITVDVTAANAGSYINMTGPVTGIGAGSHGASATLIVGAPKKKKRRGFGVFALPATLCIDKRRVSNQPTSIKYFGVTYFFSHEDGNTYCFNRNPNNINRI